jgi:hypothetical protein
MKAKQLLIATAGLWCVLGFGSVNCVQAQLTTTNTTSAASFLEEIQAIHRLGRFLENVETLQTQNILDKPTADSFSSSTWSMIDALATLSVGANCGSLTDLVADVKALGLKRLQNNLLIFPLNAAQANLSAAQAALKQGNSAAVVQDEVAVIQDLQLFIMQVNTFQQRGVLNAVTADALAACALNLVATIRADVSTGLVAYYPFNGDANDASGNGHNGTVVNATFQTNGPNAEVALSFAGNTSSYVVVPESASLEPADALSISMWCNGVQGQACGFGWGTILRKSAACQAGYLIRGCNGGTGFEIDGPNVCSGGLQISATFQTFTGANWQHIVGTYSAADGMLKTYENGVLINQTPLTSQLSHSGDLYIGGANVAGDDGGFNGLINEVRIYNRALSASDVQQLYSAGAGAHQ